MARLFGPLLALAIVVLDQLTKYTMTEHVFRPALNAGAPMPLLEWLTHAPERLAGVSLAIAPIFNLTMVWNTGISFGLMSGDNGWILTLVTLAIACGFGVWMMRSIVVMEIIALAMVVGGALGNVIDRMRFGAVVDFLDFHWGEVHFPAFNVADASISIGVALIMIHGLFFAAKGR